MAQVSSIMNLPTLAERLPPKPIQAIHPVSGFFIAVIAIWTFAVWYQPPRSCYPCLDIPSSWHREVVPLDVIRITVTPYGESRVHRPFTGYFESTWNQIDTPPMIKAAALQNPGVPFLLHADSATPYSVINLILDSLKEGGANLVIFQTTQETVQNAA